MCYLEDVTLNDGSIEAPYFGTKSFFQSFHNALNQITNVEGEVLYPFDEARC